jgi:hypothetical protein
LLPLILHALDPHAFPSSARKEVDTDSEAEPSDARTHEKDGDPDHRFHSTPPLLVRLPDSYD